MQLKLFWCGNIMLLHHLYAGKPPASVTIEFLEETIRDKDYTYLVAVDKIQYIYRYTFSSNTKCEGSMFIESNDWRSKVYTITRPFSYMHVNESSIDYHDICSFNSQCFLDTVVCSGRKKFLTTLSVNSTGNKHVVRYISLPINKVQDTHTLKAIRNMFAISGAVCSLKQVVSDAVSYESKNLMLVGYADHPLQVVGIESVTSEWRKTSTLQCINSFYNQRYDFKTISDNSWFVKEYVDNNILKRQYEIIIADDKIMVPDKKLTFSYTFDNGNIVFRRI